MKFKQHKCQIEKTDLCKGGTSKDALSINGPLFGNSIRMICAGRSGAGKTVALTQILLSTNGVRFENVYLVSPTIYQDTYTMLREVFEGTGVEYHTFPSVNDLPPVSALKPFSCVIFDDLPVADYAKVSEIFYTGRHRYIHSIFLCHTYGKLLPGILRTNANYLVLFNQSAHVLRNAYNDFACGDMNFDTFNDICRECFKEKYGFLTIARENEVNDGRYRKGFDCFVQL